LKANPATEYTNSVYIDYVEENRQFKCLYIQPSCTESTFVNCLPLVLFDGTFFLNVYHQTILLAIGQDGNNHSYLLVWAIVESENTSSWTWFIINLVTGCQVLNQPAKVGKSTIHTIVISDRDKGLLKAEMDAILNAYRAFCCWHLAKNIQQKFGLKAKQAFWKLVYV
jgi:transposase-like protein